MAGGGGFSDDFAIPAYQAEAVAAYLSQPDLPPKDMWNSTGRAYPDVSALAGQVNPYWRRGFGTLEVWWATEPLLTAR